MVAWRFDRWKQIPHNAGMSASGNDRPPAALVHAVHTWADGGNLLTIDEIAQRLRCSTKSIRRHVHAGRLPALRGPGGRLLFDPQEVRDALRPATAGNAGTSHDTAAEPANTSLAALATDFTTINA
jgi:excisionase family DNA binding protein